MKIKSIKLYQHIQIGSDLISFANIVASSSHKAYELSMVPGIGVQIDSPSHSVIATFNNISAIDLVKEEPKIEAAPAKKAKGA